MFPRKFTTRAGILLAIILQHPVFLFGQPEPQGMLIYQQPATSFTEVFEFRSFRQENVLYATVIDTAGQRKQLKAGGVLAVLPSAVESRGRFRKYCPARDRQDRITPGRRCKFRWDSFEQ